MKLRGNYLYLKHSGNKNAAYLTGMPRPKRQFVILTLISLASVRISPIRVTAYILGAGYSYRYGHARGLWRVEQPVCCVKKITESVAKFVQWTLLLFCHSKALSKFAPLRVFQWQRCGNKKPLTTNILWLYEGRGGFVIEFCFYGPKGTRTLDLFNAIEALSQLSYRPVIGEHCSRFIL